MPWSAQIHTGFHVYGATQDTTRANRVLSYGTVTRYGHTFQSVRLTFLVSHRGPITPPG
jgi:hypothetical protein